MKRRRRYTLDQLPDTLHSLFFLWQPCALRNLIRAIDRCIHTPAYRQEEIYYFDNDTRDGNSLVFPIPALGDGDTSGPTFSWDAALVRFGRDARDDVIRAHWVAWRIWARAIVLGMLTMTFAARDLMFADDVQLLEIRGARSPAKLVRRHFVARLPALHHEWLKRNYDDAEGFVADCASVYLFGNTRWSLEMRPILRTPLEPPPPPPHPLPQRKEDEEEEERTTR